MVFPRQWTVWKKVPALPIVILFTFLCFSLPEIVLAQGKSQDQMDLGTQYYSQGKFDDALAAFRKATELEPGRIKAWENLGWAHYKTGQLGEALKVWDIVLKIDPRNQEILNATGSTLMAMKQSKEAILRFRSSLILNTDQTTVRLKLAKLYLQTSQTKNAIQQYHQVLRRNPENEKVLLKLVKIYEEIGKHDLAITTLEKFLVGVIPLAMRGEKYAEISGESGGTFPVKRHKRIRFRLASLLGAKGDAYFHSSQFSKAEAEYRKALHWVHRQKHIINLGWALRKQGKNVEAIQLWKQALVLKPQPESLYRHIADAYFEDGQSSEALKWYLKASAVLPGGSDIQFRLFEISMRDKNFSKALLYLKQAFLDKDSDAKWSHQTMNHFIRAEEIDLGIKFFEKRLSISPSLDKTKEVMSRLLLIRGRNEQKENRIQSALSNFKRVIHLNPRHSAAYRDLGWIYWKQEDWENVGKVWKMYSHNLPNDVEPYNLLTRIHFQYKNYEQALVTIEKSLLIKPDQPDQHLNRVKALFETRNYEEAQKQAEKLVNEYPRHIPIQYYFGELLMRHQDFERGLKQWAKVLDLGETNPRATYYWIKSLYETGEYSNAVKKAEEYLSTHEPYAQIFWILINDALFQKHVRIAITWYEKLLSHFPETRSAWLGLVAAYQKIEQFDLARKRLNKALIILPDDIELLLTLGDLYNRGKKFRQALNIFRKVQMMYPENRRAFLGILSGMKGENKFLEAKKHLESEKGRFLKGYEKELEWGNLEVANGNLSGAKIYYQRVALPGKNVFYIPILLYHGLSPQPRSPNLWVKRFADQNKALRQAGYTAITFKELNQILQGKAPLPAKPILITFDDARIDAFQIADPILKKYRMKATMFIPTGRILFKHPFFADWHMIRRYARSGRWNIQNHGHLAHDLIPIDAEGNEGNFLTSYKWLGQQGRKETSEEYILRLQEDHSSSTRVIQEEVPGSSVVAYAFPFSEAGQGGQGNVKNARRINERLLKKNFKFGLIQDLSGYNRLALGEKSPRFLKRFSVPREWSGGQLVQHLALKHPAHLATLATAKSQFWEGKFKKAQRTFKYLETKEPHFKPSIQSYFKKISYHSGHYRTAEKYLLAEQSQTATGKSDSPKLKQNILWKNRPQVISRFNYFGDSDDRTNLSISERFTFPLKIPMDLFVEGSYLNFEEDGFNDLRGYETVVGSTFWSSSLPLQFEGKIKHRSLDGIDDTQSYWASARYMMDNSRLHFRWSDQDVETLQALVAGIQVQDYQLVYQPRILSSLRGNFSLSYKDYDDGNSRFDARAQWRYKLPKLKRWEFGTDLSYLDTDFQTGLYYTPEELLLGMGKINFRESFGSRSVLNLQFGVGGAHDELSGTRSVINAGLRLEYYFTPRLKTELRGNYSQLPNYKSYNLQTQIDYRF